jgi:hypothetical protein
MQSTKILVLFTIFALTSCVTDKRIFQKQRFVDLGQLKLTTAIKLEKKENSKDITPDYLIGIGEDIYPNKNNFVLATPKTYQIKERPNFVIKTDYFYSINDSSVKVILYQWDNLTEGKSDLFEEENFTKKYKVFQKKFDSLKEKLTKELGQPVEINIEQNKSSDETFRDDVKWKNSSGLNAYLFMFSNNSGYRQIRLVVYKDK